MHEKSMKFIYCTKRYLVQEMLSYQKQDHNESSEDKVHKSSFCVESRIVFENGDSLIENIGDVMAFL